MKLLIRLTNVRVLAGHRVLLAFDDGSEGDVDLAPHLRGPVFQPLLDDRALFEAAYVDRELRTLAWPNGADMDPDVLHNLAHRVQAPK